MQDPWQTLGLEPTDDVLAIKRAYAAKLRVTRPDDDARAYQARRQAYEWAVVAGADARVGTRTDSDQRCSSHALAHRPNTTSWLQEGSGMLGVLMNAALLHRIHLPFLTVAFASIVVWGVAGMDTAGFLWLLPAACVGMLGCAGLATWLRQRPWFTP